jgi:hypothetical protein
MTEQQDALERLRASVARMRERVSRMPDPEPKGAPLPMPTTDSVPPKPWCETEREPGEEG